MSRENKTSFWGKIGSEKILGGVFGAIAIIAIIIQMATLEFAKDAIWGGIKDIATTMVAIMVLLVAIKQFLPPKEDIETFDRVLQNELNAWEKRNKPIICKDVTFPRKDNDKDEWCKVRYNLLTDIEKILFCDPNQFQELENTNSKNSGSENGMFLDFPVDLKKDIIFHLNESTFSARSINTKEEIKSLAPAFAKNILKKFESICEEAISSKDGKKISVTLKRFDILTPDIAREIVKLIDYTLMLFIITQ